MEKIQKIDVHCVIGVLADNGNVNPAMAMFLASQPYMLSEFDCRVFDTREGANIFTVFHWMVQQEADVYLFMTGSICPHPDLVQLLWWRLQQFEDHVVVPPVWISNNGTKQLNVKINGEYRKETETCGYEPCQHAETDLICMDRAAICSLFMSNSTSESQELTELLVDLGFKVMVDWTVEPITKWEDELRIYGNKILNAYSLWFTRVKRGLPI